MDREEKVANLSSDTAPKALIDLGSSITGNLAATAASFVVGGAPGAVVGAAVGPLTTALAGASVELLSRQLSQRGRTRVGAAYTFAVNRI